MKAGELWGVAYSSQNYIYIASVFVYKLYINGGSAGLAGGCGCPVVWVQLL